MGTGAGQYGRGHGIAFIGTKGTLVVNRSGWEVIAENGRMESVPLALKSDVGLDIHAQNFVDVIKSGKKEDLACPIYAGARVAINAHMGKEKKFTGMPKRDCLHRNQRTNLSNLITITASFIPNFNFNFS
jgi:hypothetical protein